MIKFPQFISLFILLCFYCSVSLGQGFESFKTGVVKVTAEFKGHKKRGTGIIVKLSRQTAHIITASHVVEGDETPDVTFFENRTETYPASVIGLEGGDSRGMALLLVKGHMDIPAGLEAMTLETDARVSTGDEILSIGFPLSGGDWSLVKGNIVARKGRDLIFSADVDEGFSGGPVISNGVVVGLVVNFLEPYGHAVPMISMKAFLDGWDMSELGTNSDYSIRIKPGVLSTDEVISILRARGLHDKLWNPEGNFQNLFEEKTIQGEKVIVDHASRLMWQHSVSEDEQHWNELEGYVVNLNNKKYAGFSDWRLPTLVELASLLEPFRLNLFFYIDPIFNVRARLILEEKIAKQQSEPPSKQTFYPSVKYASADRVRAVGQVSTQERWFIDFGEGDIDAPAPFSKHKGNLAGPSRGFVKAVRSIPEKFHSADVRHGRLGVYLEIIDDNMKEALGVPHTELASGVKVNSYGALVAEVVVGGPTDRAGIKKDDVILQFDGEVVPFMQALPIMVSQRPSGKEVALEILRKDRKQTINVVLGSGAGPSNKETTLQEDNR